MADNAPEPTESNNRANWVKRWFERRRWAAAELGPWEQKEGLRARIAELEAILDAVAMRAAEDSERSDLAPKYLGRAQKELEAARSALEHSAHPAIRGAAHLGVAQSHVDAAQNLIIWLASPSDVKAMLPQLVALVEEHFARQDPRRVRVKEIAREFRETNELPLSQRAFLAETASLARRLLRKETLRVRSFVRIVAAVATAMLLIAIGVAIAAYNWPWLVPLCFTPEDGGMFTIVCPTNSNGPVEEVTTEEIAHTALDQDYLLIEVAGAVSASVASAAALRHIRGTALPYNVPLVLALLKLPTGALTALLGLVLMRGGFVPGLSALDSSAQIIAWAVVFGYSQQLFTKFVDSQGQALLDAVRGPNSPPVTEASTP
ncbi:hypothetical protein ACFYR1_52390 [Streptomyces canus]|uniref:hypothetical protein n=1 Tax=Streptomyces canus TaxID=58343 RepID=UPI0036BDB915